jgi:hypothetical protein
MVTSTCTLLGSNTRLCDDLRHVAAWGLSCGALVLVRESAEDLSSADLVLGEVDRLWWLIVGLSRCELAEGTVRPALDWQLGIPDSPELANALTRGQLCA